jgi:hypothetical protein
MRWKDLRSLRWVCRRCFSVLGWKRGGVGVSRVLLSPGTHGLGEDKGFCCEVKVEPLSAAPRTEEGGYRR